jgi:hypothetical protein
MSSQSKQKLNPDIGFVQVGDALRLALACLAEQVRK